MVVHSAAGIREGDLAMANQDLTINDAISQLVDQLAVFCFKHLERSLDPNRSNVIDDIGNHIEGNVFENELEVQDNV